MIRPIVDIVTIITHYDWWDTREIVLSNMAVIHIHHELFNGGAVAVLYNGQPTIITNSFLVNIGLSANDVAIVMNHCKNTTD